MLKFLKYLALVVVLVIIVSIVWIISSEKRQTTAIQIYDRVATGIDSSTFVFKPNGDILVYALDCEDTGLTHQHATPNTRTTVIEGVNHKRDDVERVSSQFLRINGKIYDAYVAEFQRMGIDKTHNIANKINEKTFAVTDNEEQYFTDSTNYYFYEYYPTFRACFSGHNSSIPQIPTVSEKVVGTEPILLNEFQLDSPEEAKFYLSQENNIFTDERYGYTPYAELNGELYFKQPTGKFTLVEGAKSQGFIELMDNYSSYSSLYTDGQNIIFHGEVLNLDINTFEAVMVRPQSLGYDIVTGFFKANNQVYYLTKDRLGSLKENSNLINVGADAETFEVVDTNGSLSGRVYQDNGYIYSFNKESENFIKKPR